MKTFQVPEFYRSPIISAVKEFRKVQDPRKKDNSPTVLDFGYRPWSNQTYIIEKVGLACRPCGKHGGHTCPIKTHDCMTHISASEVSQQAQVILQ